MLGKRGHWHRYPLGHLRGERQPSSGSLHMYWEMLLRPNFTINTPYLAWIIRRSSLTKICLSISKHYNDVVMGTIASQITSLTIVYSTVYSDADPTKTSKLRITGLCVGKSTGTGEFPAQMVSNSENVSIWLRHHDKCCRVTIFPRFVGGLHFIIIMIIDIKIHARIMACN